MTSYSDADYIGYRVDRKSTSGTCQFLKNYLILWSFKKKNFVALLTIEAEYVAVEAYCAQIF